MGLMSCGGRLVYAVSRSESHVLECSVGDEDAMMVGNSDQLSKKLA